MIKLISTVNVFLICFVSCSTTMQTPKSGNSEIKSVKVTNTFGRGGTTVMTATKDSLISENRSIASKEIPNFKRKIDPKNWNNLIDGIDLNLVEKTKSGESRMYYDGPDEIYEISTKDKTYTLVNVADPLQNKQLKDLKVLLKKMVAQ